MPFNGLLKKIVKGALGKFGYEIRALNILHAKNAVEYNSALFVDRFYADPVLSGKYIKEDVPVNLRNLETLLHAHPLSLNGDTSVLDAGCGTGHCLRMFHDKYGCGSLAGIELSQKALQIARETCPSGRFYQMDMAKDSLGEQFDLVLCQQVLEHLTRPEWALKNLVKMLRRNGTLIITVPDGRLDDFAGHIHFWSKDSFPVFFEKELPGYTVITGSLQDGVSLYAMVRSGREHQQSGPSVGL
jgi:SAM-dependent methyltransferase